MASLFILRSPCSRPDLVLNLCLPTLRLPISTPEDLYSPASLPYIPVLLCTIYPSLTFVTLHLSYVLTAPAVAAVRPCLPLSLTLEPPPP